MNLDPWVERALRILDAHSRAKFAQNPEQALTAQLGLTVRPVERLSEARDDGGFCDGMSFLEDGVILYAPTPNSRRQNFTLAHELGHWIVEQDSGLFDWIADQDEPAALLETVCDRIAQRLLLPEDLTADVVQAGPVRARHVQELYNASQASYQACAIGISRRIRGLGAVVLIERFGSVVNHASVRPDEDDGWPVVYPWRGQTILDGHALLGIPLGGSFTRRIWWRNQWGKEAEFFADAVADDRRIIVILADQDQWQVEPGRVLQPRDFDERPLLRTYCCGKERWVRGYPCPHCRQPFCSNCRRCACDRQAASQANCVICNLILPGHLLENGVCEDCR